MSKNLLCLFAVSFIMSCGIRHEKNKIETGYMIAYDRYGILNPEKTGFSDIHSKNRRSVNNEYGPDLSGKIAVHPDVSKSNNSKAKINQYRVSSDPGRGLTGYANRDKDFNASSNTDKVFSEEIVLENKESEDSNADGYLYLLAGMMGLSAFSLVLLNRKKTFHVTRWANRNKLKSRVLIGLSQIALGTLGVLTGKNLSALGYDISNNPEYVFGGLMALGYLNLLLNEKKGIVLPESFNMRKLSHVAIGASLFASALSIGNNIAQDKVNVSPMAYTIESLDHSLSGADPVEFTSSAKTADNGAGALAVLYFLLSILLLIGLAIISCAAFCAGGPVAGIPVTIGSIILFILVVRAMTNSVRRRRGE